MPSLQSLYILYKGNLGPVVLYDRSRHEKELKHNEVKTSILNRNPEYKISVDDEKNAIVSENAQSKLKISKQREKFFLKVAAEADFRIKKSTEYTTKLDELKRNITKLDRPSETPGPIRRAFDQYMEAKEALFNPPDNPILRDKYIAAKRKLGMSTRLVEQFEVDIFKASDKSFQDGMIRLMAEEHEIEEKKSVAVRQKQTAAVKTLDLESKAEREAGDSKEVINAKKNESASKLPLIRQILALPDFVKPTLSEHKIYLVRLESLLKTFLGSVQVPSSNYAEIFSNLRIHFAGWSREFSSDKSGLMGESPEFVEINKILNNDPAYSFLTPQEKCVMLEVNFCTFFYSLVESSLDSVVKMHKMYQTIENPALIDFLTEKGALASTHLTDELLIELNTNSHGEPIDKERLSVSLRQIFGPSFNFSELEFNVIKKEASLHAKLPDQLKRYAKNIRMSKEEKEEKRSFFSKRPPEIETVIGQIIRFKESIKPKEDPKKSKERLEKLLVAANINLSKEQFEQFYNEYVSPAIPRRLGFE